MASDTEAAAAPRQHQHQHQGEPAGAGESTSKPKPSTEQTPDKKARKRTKTGCLTCRKRRIKCGEERPICNNCIKSKRHCEGYNQRVIFKPPIGDWPAAQGNISNTLPYHSGVIPGARPVYQQQFPPASSTKSPYTPAQAGPSGQYQFPLPNYGQLNPGPSPQPNPIGAATTRSGGYTQPSPPRYTLQPSHLGSQPEQSHSVRTYSVSSLPTDFGSQISFSPSTGSNFQRTQSTQLHYHPTTEAPTTQPGYSQPAPPQDYSQAQQPYQQASSFQGTPFASQQGPTYPFGASGTVNRDREVLHQADQDVLLWHKIANGLASGHETQQYFPKIRAQQDHGSMAPQTSSIAAQPIMEQAQPASQFQQEVPFDGLLQRTGYAEDHVSPTEVLQDAAVEYEDDDYWDVHSEDEMELVPEQSIVQGRNQQLDLMLQIHRDSVNDLSIRSYGAFLHPGTLDNYRPEQVANPLRNPKTARVFAHFIHATGPSLSVYERNLRNASAMFFEGPAHPTQQSLWTYTLPMMALNHQGLLHAMLALASLHIANLQGASVTPSIKHYAYALKRVHHCVGHPQKRHRVTTLAAALLLGFYEVMTADHVKWSSHLLGAKQLFVEIDYAGMTKAWRKRKADEEAYERNFAYANPGMTMQQPRMSKEGTNRGPDERLVSTIIGKELRYDEFGQVEEEGGQQGAGAKVFPDLDHYEIYQDLWWWYVRHDAFQALISGNRLLMDYTKWADCPPRAPLGKQGAVYGSHDHLILFLGRVADFASKDRERKIRQIEVNGGHWQPAPGMQMGGALGKAGGGGPPGPPGHPSAMSTPQGGAHAAGGGGGGGGGGGVGGGGGGGGGGPPTQAPAPPPNIPFYGMAPSAPKNRMPSAFAASNTSTTSSSTPSSAPNADLQAATRTALAEWAALSHALDTFIAHLGPSFQALPADVAPVQPPTPFGPALHYRSFDVAILWALALMCRIILARCHPHMPPAAMVAAGVAAPQTAAWAGSIGRICAGVIDTLLHPSESSNPGSQGQSNAQNAALNPSVGAALLETVMPLFFAGIQYVDTAQRTWLVQRVSAIEARTGWASAGLVAQGCQKAWERAGAAGRGPAWPPLNTSSGTNNNNDVNSSSSSSNDNNNSSSVGVGVGGVGVGIGSGGIGGVVGAGVVGTGGGEDRGVRRGERESVASGRGELTQKRFIWSNPATRVHWALGILSGEEDVMSLGEGGGGSGG